MIALLSLPDWDSTTLQRILAAGFKKNTSSDDQTTRRPYTILTKNLKDDVRKHFNFTYALFLSPDDSVKVLANFHGKMTLTQFEAVDLVIATGSLIDWNLFIEDGLPLSEAILDSFRVTGWHRCLTHS